MSTERTFLGHPTGLSTLFFTEMWERFSYYGMKALLILYMVAPLADGGLGFSDGRAGIIFGTYTAMVYLMGLPGGWIADRFLGQRRAVLFGGILIMAGHVSLAVPSMTTFYLGLALVVLGTGLLKPNISAMVGQLYARDADARRDAGFSIFYMGINTGAFLAPLACGFLAQSDTFRGVLVDAGINPHHSWHFGFAAAAVGMFFGLVQYMLGGKNLGEAGKAAAPIKDAADDAKRWRTLWVILGVVFGVPMALGVLDAVGAIGLTADNVGKGFGYVLAATPVVLFAGLLAMKSWTVAERKQIIVIMVLFFGAAVFWSCFEQAGSTLNLFAQRHTSASLLGVTFPASWFQSLNAIFVVAMAPVFAGLWVMLSRRGREPSSPLKFGIGMVLVGLGFVIMLPAALSVGGNLLGGGERVSPGWLVSLYFVHTLAEMCISPVGLSSMTKLAPQRIAGMVMGIWFLAASVGNYMAGLAAAVTEHTMMKTFFVIMTVFPIVMALVLFGATRPIRRMMEAKSPAQ